MYKPPTARPSKEEPALCFARVEKAAVKPGNYVSPSNRGPKEKTFDELFPTLGDGTVCLKFNKPGPRIDEKKEEEDNRPKTFAERIQKKLDMERKEAEGKIQITQVYKNDDEDNDPGPLPNLAKYLKAVEATRLRKLKEIELRNKIFESDTEEEQEYEEEEEDLDDLYPLDDEEDENNNETYDANDFDRHN